MFGPALPGGKDIAVSQSLEIPGRGAYQKQLEHNKKYNLWSYMPNPKRRFFDKK